MDEEVPASTELTVATRVEAPSCICRSSAIFSLWASAPAGSSAASSATAQRREIFFSKIERSIRTMKGVRTFINGLRGFQRAVHK